MSDSAPPERPSSDPSSSVPPHAPEASRERLRRRLEGAIPEIIKRAIELGIEKARESPEGLKQFASDMRLPKDIAHYLLQQIDETKNGLFRVVAKEMRDFLEHTNFAGEIEKILTTVQFEVNTTIRFRPNDGREKPPAPSDSRQDENPDESSDGGTPVTTGTGENHSLPRPEVKTALHVRRDDNSERKRRSERGS